MDDQESPIDALIARFPRLFKGQALRVFSDLPVGWNTLANDLFADIDHMLDDHEAPHFEVLQIKEKFAGLRVYWRLGEQKTLTADLFGDRAVQRLELGPQDPTPLFELIRERVLQAELAAARCCQRCGQAGTRRQLGWLVTLCDRCAAASGTDEDKS